MLALISPRALLVSAIFFPTSHAGPYDLLNLAGRLQAGSAPKKTLSRSPLNLLATNSSANDDMSSNWDPVGETDIHHPSGLCETDKYDIASNTSSSRDRRILFLSVIRSCCAVSRGFGAGVVV